MVAIGKRRAVSAVGFFSFPPLGSSVLKPNLKKEKKEWINYYFDMGQMCIIEWKLKKRSAGRISEGIRSRWSVQFVFLRERQSKKSSLETRSLSDDFSTWLRAIYWLLSAPLSDRFTKAGLRRRKRSFAFAPIAFKATFRLSTPETQKKPRSKRCLGGWVFACLTKWPYRERKSLGTGFSFIPY